MHDSIFHRATYLTGPTASGKTAVGIALAARMGAEVIALDSMTLYRGLDIGTAKPTAAERGGIPHHLIDVLDPWESASVADYRTWAARAALEIEARGGHPLFVGGTPMYLKVLLRGLFDGPPADPELRQALEAEAQQLGDAALHARLADVDPAAAARLHPNDRRRVARALEVHALLGQPLSELQAQHERPAPPDVMVLALDPPREDLHRRIERRADAMIAGGWLDEVEGLLQGPHPLHPVPAQAVGYKELMEHLADPATTSLGPTVERIKARTRQFAKRQGTWFRALREVVPWPIESREAPERTAERLAVHLRRPHLDAR